MREVVDVGFDVLIVCVFNYDVYFIEFEKFGCVFVLKVCMNVDLYMVDDLKNMGKGNLFVIFGELDIDVLDVENE